MRDQSKDSVLETIPNHNLYTRTSLNDHVNYAIYYSIHYRTLLLYGRLS